MILKQNKNMLKEKKNKRREAINELFKENVID